MNRVVFSMIREAEKLEEKYESSFKKSPENGMKTLLNLYRGSYGKLFGSAVAFLIKNSPCWILPLFVANIINFATNPLALDKTKFLWSSVAFAVLLVLNVPFHYLHVYLYSTAVRKAEAGLRLSLVTKLQHLSITYHKEMEEGRLQSKLMRDVEQVQMLSEQLFINLLNIALTLVITISVTLSKSIIVFVFFLLAVPVAVLITMLFRKKVKERNKEFRNEMENTSAKMIEMVDLVPVARAHALENWEIRRMTNQINKVKQKGLKLDTFQAFFGSVSWATFQLFQVLCLVFCGVLAYKKLIPAGDIVIYQSYFSSIVGSISTLIGLIPILAKGLESVTSIGDILLSDDVEDNRNKVKLKEVKGDFQFQDVSFHYRDDDKIILDKLNLHVQQGETIALVGESGSGKTTILNLAIGFNLPTDGTFLIDGQDVRNLDLHAYRKHIAVVPQEPILFTGTIRENITYGLAEATDEQVQAVVEAAHLTEVIDRLPKGLDTELSEHGANLSGGQKQRISIARALIRNPQVIVLDEATSALDSVSERKIQKALDTLTENRTTFVVAHRLSTIQNADRIAVIDKGKCVEIGTYDELMQKKGAFYAFKKLQQ